MYLGGNFVLYSQDELSQKNGYSPPLAYNARENEDFFFGHCFTPPYKTSNRFFPYFGQGSASENWKLLLIFWIEEGFGYGNWQS